MPSCTLQLVCWQLWGTTWLPVGTSLNLPVNSLSVIYNEALSQTVLIMSARAVGAWTNRIIADIASACSVGNEICLDTTPVLLVFCQAVGILVCRVALSASAEAPPLLGTCSSCLAEQPNLDIPRLPL